MTTINRVPVRCACCGTTADVVVICSTHAFGSADLDTRPPEMMRSTLAYGVARCDACGYCAPELGETSPGAAEAMTGTRYRDLLADPELPEKTRQFACWAEIARAGKLWRERAWALVHAAWAADDAGHAAVAGTMRLAAVDAIAEAHEAGVRIAGQDGADEAIEVDLLRRAGAFDAAGRAILAGLRRVPEPLVRRVLEYQAELVDRRDIGAHVLAEVIKDAD